MSVEDVVEEPHFQGGMRMWPLPAPWTWVVSSPCSPVFPTYAWCFLLTDPLFFLSRCKQPCVIVAFQEVMRMNFCYCCYDSHHLSEQKKDFQSVTHD